MKRLKLFLYKKEDCQLEPNATYRPVPVLSQPPPDRFQLVPEPAQADFLVFPVWAHRCGCQPCRRSGLCSVTHCPDFRMDRKFEEKHVFFLPGVDTSAPLFTRAVTFRHSVHRKFSDLNAVVYPYDAYDPPVPPQYDNLVYHTVFAGFIGSWKGRLVLAQALAQIKDLNCCWKVTQEFHYHGSPQDQAVHRKLTLRASKRQ